MDDDLDVFSEEFDTVKGCDKRLRSCLHLLREHAESEWQVTRIKDKIDQVLEVRHALTTPEVSSDG